MVSVDAIGTQKNIVSKIIKKQWHYCLDLKENQKTMYQEVKEYFDFALKDKEESKKILKLETEVFGHGRTRTRRYYAGKGIEFLTQKKELKNLSNIGFVVNKREEKNHTCDGVSVKFLIFSQRVGDGIYSFSVLLKPRQKFTGCP